jgi:uncharacterized protein YjlB
LRLGGPQGVDVKIQAGDVVIIPAGGGHPKRSSSSEFAVVGAYPRGQSPDKCRGKADAVRRAENDIQAVPLPEMDPVYGLSGGLLAMWYPQDP